MAPGPRSKFGALVFEPEVFRKQMYFTEVLVTLLGLFGARGIVPLSPVVTPLVTARSDAPQQIMVRSSNQRHRGTLGFRRGKIFNSLEFLRHFEEKGEIAGRWFCFRNLPKIIGKFFLNVFNLVRTFLSLLTPLALTQKLWQNTSYIQLSGLNNWIYVVITIFAQHLIICSPKLMEWRRLLPPPGYASANSDWWLCGFEPCVAVANP